MHFTTNYAIYISIMRIEYLLGPCYLILRTGFPQVPSSVLQSGSDGGWGRGQEASFTPLVSQNSFHIPDLPEGLCSAPAHPWLA